MNYLLYSDTHFTDKPIEEYRWKIFPFLTEQALKYDVKKIICLGDLVDRADRHSGLLVNYLVEMYADLKHDTKAELTILAGNHDKPLQRPYFWEFLSRVGVDYLTNPIYDWNRVLYLPFSSNAVKEWGVFHSDTKAILMHQTIEGAIVEDDRRIPSSPYPLPPLPHIPIYSGDVHRPQSIDNITYVGAPYPVRFGETWDTRIIVIQNDDWQNPISIQVPSIKRAILDIHNSKELLSFNYKTDDQLKIRYHLKSDSLTSYAEEEIVIRKWAKDRGITIVSIEPQLVGELKTQDKSAVSELMPPKEVIRTFAEQEKLSEDVAQMGQEILNECN